MTTIREKTITGMVWSFIDNFGTRIVNFGFGIVLARLLVPQDYGLVGMVAIFIALAQVFVDSGFSQALLRNKQCTLEEYSTVFFFNFGIGLLFYGILFLGAPYISNFFAEPDLILLMRVIGFMVVINSLAMVQRVILSQRLDFKSQAKYSVTASLFSSGGAVYLANAGYGVWSLVVKMLCEAFLNAAFLWHSGRFALQWKFDVAAFRTMFAFGSKLLVSGLLDCAYNQVYKLVIGKVFLAKELGYYTRASQFTELPSSGISAIVSRVTFPIFSQMEPHAIKSVYKKIQISLTFVTACFLIGVASISTNMVAVLLGEKWLPSAPYLQLLCIALCLYPVHVLNLQILLVKGYSDLFLKLEIFKKSLVVPIVFVGIYSGIIAMLYGMIVSSLISFGLNSHYGKRLIGYSTKEQMIDLLPGLLLAAAMGVGVYVLGEYLSLTPFQELGVQIVAGIVIVVTIAEMTRLVAYWEIRNVLLARIRGYFNVR